MIRLTTKSKIIILKDAIKHLKRRNCCGMCTAIGLAFNKYNDNVIVNALDIYYNYPDFTHDNYIKFYRFNKTVKIYARGSYWDSYGKVISLIRRIIFLRYLILKLRIQQFKRWYTILH